MYPVGWIGWGLDESVQDAVEIGVLFVGHVG